MFIINHLIIKEMKNTKSQTVFYNSPVVDIVNIESTLVLCSSSGELDDLKKEDFDFNWGN